MNLFERPLAWLDRLRPMPTGQGMVIVAGMPKSGTTAIAKLLGAATGQSVCSDPFYALSQMKVDFRQKLSEGHIRLETLWRRYRHIFSGTIVKDPSFVLLLDQLRELFPMAQIVFIIRDPRDNIRSILNRLNLPGNPEEGNINLDRLPIGWRHLLSGQYPKVEGRDYVEVLSRRWIMAVEELTKHKEYCVEIRYEDFKKNKSASIFELAKKLGYCNLINIDKLADVQYQPKGNSSVQWAEFFGEKHLAVINRITGPMLSEFGYEVHSM